MTRLSSNRLGSVLTPSTVFNIGDLETCRRMGVTKLMRAFGLVAFGQIEGALLVPAIVADRIEDVGELIVVGDPAALVVQARCNVVDAVGRGHGQLSVVEEVIALVRRHKLVVHVDAATPVRLLRRRLAKSEVVPGVVGNVVRTTGLVNLQ